MTKHIAFLRAINVGGHIVKMNRLRELFEILEFSNVETFIASGNVIFDAKSKSSTSLEKKISSHLQKDLGYEVDTFLRTHMELIDLEKRCPFQPKTKEDNAYVAFLHEPLNTEGKTALMAAKNQFNEFAVVGREIYWLRLNKDDTIFLKSSLEKIIQTPTTMRNMTTIHKLAEKYK